MVARCARQLLLFYWGSHFIRNCVYGLFHTKVLQSVFQVMRGPQRWLHRPKSSPRLTGPHGRGSLRLVSRALEVFICCYFDITSCVVRVCVVVVFREGENLSYGAYFMAHLDSS